MSGAAEIVFDQVTKRYAGRKASDQRLSLTIPAGTFCVLVGPSGGGKTTALKLVNRLVCFDEGRSRSTAAASPSFPPVELRRGIGYVIQQSGLFPHMTIGDNIATVPRLLGWPRARHARASRSCSSSSASSLRRGRYPAQLSGGQRQRVGLARALAADPPILLMDEPFGALDPITRIRLQDELARLHREVAKTVIFVTHDIDEAIRMGEQHRDPARGGCARPVRHARRGPRPAGRRVRRPLRRRGPGAATARLAPRPRSSSTRPSPGGDGRAPGRARTSVRNAVSLMLGAGTRTHRRPRAHGAPTGILTLAHATELLHVDRPGPRHPQLRRRLDCVLDNDTFCFDWVRAALGRHASPGAPPAPRADAIAVGIGFTIAFAAASSRIATGEPSSRSTSSRRSCTRSRAWRSSSCSSRSRGSRSRRSRLRSSPTRS